MYVKWQRRPRKRVGGSPLLTAVLVESRRVDGNPRQKHVAYLASIRERFIGVSQGRHDGFWESVDAGLDALGLDADSRDRVEASVAEKVPRVAAKNRDELEAAMASRAHAMATETARKLRQPRI